ncbi:hypothetical protein PENNAL_c0032G08935 [Penicillium nalgiovense]|uniref:Uncharacterized protein n=1 Tax=Penicillium nalgiovense TaxID=60175 RepID=A0A1V6Y7W5_PENNA|nr:hypothetical protein PENNAL_c0032G08935 [Penicillium nalgiovense]
MSLANGPHECIATPTAALRLDITFTILSGWTITAAVVISACLVPVFPAFARRLPPICTQHGVVPLMFGLQVASVLGNLELKNDAALEKEREYVVSPQSQLSPPP